MRTPFQQLLTCLLLISILSFAQRTSAQLADGTIAPDFTVTDIDGDVHNLTPISTAAIL